MDQWRQQLLVNQYAVVIGHEPGGKLPLLFAMPEVIFSKKTFHFVIGDNFAKL